MAVKANWQNGEQFNASDQNAVAEAVNAAYVKPSGGVPITDLTASVQVSLGKADTAVQSVNAASITDSTTTGRAVITAVDAAAARTTLGVSYGTTAGTVVQGNDSRLSPSSTSITDSTATGRSLITAVDPAAARTAIGVAYGSTGGTVAQGNDSRIVGAEQTANKGVANGYASLDGGGKVPVSQLPSSIMEYQGTYNASTNSPSLVNGTGNTGDVYRVSVAGTRNFGAGNISFEVGDYVIYNGSVWEKSDTTDAVSTVAGLTGDVSTSALKTALSLNNVDDTGDASKNVLSATKLTTPRTINGVAFDGTANITVPTFVRTSISVTEPGVTLASAAGTEYFYSLGRASNNSASNLLHFDEAWTAAQITGDTAFVDESGLKWGGNIAGQNTSIKKFGTGSAFFSGTTSGSTLYPAGASTSAWGTGDYTIECQIYPTSINASNSWVFDCGTSQFGVWITPSLSIVFRTGGNTDRITSAANAIVLNQWQHIALTRTSSVVRLFVNGTQVGSTYTDTTNYGAIWEAPRFGAMHAAAWNDATGSNFAGYMDEIRIAKTSYFSSNFTPPTAAYTHSWGNSITLPSPVGNQSYYNIRCNLPTDGYTSARVYFQNQSHYISTDTSSYGPYGSPFLTTTGMNYGNTTTFTGTFIAKLLNAGSSWRIYSDGTQWLTYYT